MNDVTPAGRNSDSSANSASGQGSASESGATPKQAGGESVTDIVRSLGPAAILGAGALLLPPLGSLVLFYYIDSVGQWLRGHGVEGVALYAAAFAVLAGLALLPTYASAILGGWAFGFAKGFPAALLGFFGGSLIGYAIARRASAQRVDAVMKRHPKWEAVRQALVGSGFGKTLLIVTLVRLPPNSPFALTNLVLASVRTNVVAYALGTLLGMAPRTGVVLYLAAQWRSLAAAEALDQKKPWWLIAVGVALAIGVLMVLGNLAQRALNRLTAAPPVPSRGAPPEQHLLAGAALERDGPTSAGGAGLPGSQG
ncbi:MAG: VTT domain-containing protein [Planctomycetota bacterium]|nr:VTT domain-containing protein [Planctomycetota bacterium]